MKIFGIDERAVREAIAFAVPAALEAAVGAGPQERGEAGAGPRGRGDGALARRLFALAAWSYLVEPGDSAAATLVHGLGAARALQVLVDRASAAQITDELRQAEASARDASGPLEVATITKALARWAPRFSLPPVMLALAEARRSGLGLLVPGDARWPHRLDDLGAHAPLCMWTRGHTAALQRGPTVSIVGARAATSYGEHVAMELSSELTARGVVVVSGAAYGIDGVAHRAALAAGGPTIAVLAGGADRAYPAGHADLLDRVAENGAVISELAPGAAPTRWRFLQRNRLISALGEATVVVEAGSRSGSLNTAGHAATLGRPVGAVPGPVTSAASAGCHRLLREFDARCVTSADDVLELIGGGRVEGSVDASRRGVPKGQTATIAAAASESRTDDSTRVTDALSTRGWRTPADVAGRAGFSLEEAESLLGVLALEGRVERGDAGWRLARSA